MKPIGLPAITYWVGSAAWGIVIGHYHLHISVAIAGVALLILAFMGGEG